MGQMRHFLEDEKPTHNTHTNNYLKSELNDGWAGNDNELCSVVVCDALELVDMNV